MFKCGLCEQLIEKGEKGVRFVLKQRMAEYPFIKNAHKISKNTYRDDPGGKGLQIVQEFLAHKKCVDKANFKTE